MVRTGSARWRGGIKDGSGTVSTASGALKELGYNFRGRFENEPGTNPEELIGAAHAACYSMAFSLFSANAGKTLDFVETKANVSLDAKDGGFAITRIHLDVTAKLPNTTDEEFQKIAADTKANCPVSKVLNAEITLSARLA